MATKERNRNKHIAFVPHNRVYDHLETK